MRGVHVGALLLVASLGLTSCTDDDPLPDDSPDADTGSSGAAPASDAVSESNRSTSYSYTLRSSCGYGLPHGIFAVIEREGAIKSVEAVRGRQPGPNDIPTLKELIAKARKARPKAMVDLVVDRDGLPVFLKVDNDRHEQDDEECYEVRDLEALDGPEATTDDVDLSGQWHLDEADIAGERFTIPSDVHISLVDHWKDTQAHVVCDILILGSPRVSGDEVEIIPLSEPGSMMSCPPMWEPSPLPAETYFAALSAVEHGVRASEMLVLTGPDVTLTYQRGP